MNAFIHTYKLDISYVLTWKFIRLNSYIQAKKLVCLTVELSKFNHRVE